MEQKTTIGSPLERFYHSVNKTAQTHFRSAWMEHFGLTRDAFYKRLKVPNIEDLALFGHVFNVLTVSDQINRSYDFSQVQKYEVLETIETLIQS